MKKLIISLLVACFAATAGFTQVMQKQGVQNNLWMGMGVPTGTSNDANREGFRWVGLIDTIQGRVDLWKFTVDGMLAWGAFYNGSDFRLENTALKPEHFMYTNYGRLGKLLEPINYNAGRRSNGYNIGDGTYGNDSYYINIVFHAIEGLDLGIGTRLEWDVGPAPSYGAYTWEFKSHVHQGDLRDGKPGSVPVAGFVKYGNTYAQKAIGLRYKYNKLFEIGFAIPSGFSTNVPATNFGFSITPIDFITAAFAYEGLFLDDSNLYTGATIRIKNLFVLDAYLTFNGIGNGYNNNGRWGTGAAVTLNFPKAGIYLRPEVGFSGYANSDYTMAVYTGAKLNFDFAERCHLGVWASLAWGAEQVSWHSNNNPRNDYFGGFIFNIRPEFSFDINKNHTVAVTTEFESLTDYQRNIVDSWLIGFYWRFNY